MTTTTTTTELVNGMYEMMETIKSYLSYIERATMKQDNAMSNKEYDEALLEAQNAAMMVLRTIEKMGYDTELLININEPDVDAPQLIWKPEIKFE